MIHVSSKYLLTNLNSTHISTFQQSELSLQLPTNSHKSEHHHFSTKLFIPDFHIDDELFPTLNHISHLAVIMRSHLNFNSHISIIFAKISAHLQSF